MRQLFKILALISIASFLLACAGEKPQPEEIYDSEDCSSNDRFKDDCE